MSDLLVTLGILEEPNEVEATLDVLGVVRGRTARRVGVPGEHPVSVPVAGAAVGHPVAGGACKFKASWPSSAASVCDTIVLGNESGSRMTGNAGRRIPFCLG